MKDAVATMGMILPDDAGGRDAVHVAVFSAVSDERLSPGQHVSPVGSQSGMDVNVCSAGNKGIGIVDPFVAGMIPIGERFWVYLYPRTITALSHRWSHPAFEATETVYTPPADKLVSEQWLRDFCERSDCPGYETVLGAASEVVDGGVVGWSAEHLHFNDRDAHGDIPDEFWDHVEVVLGRPIQGERAKYFSCSC